MPGLIDIPGTHYVRARVPGQATAGTANNWVVAQMAYNATILGAVWVPDAAVTGANTNNFALGVVNKGAAAGQSLTVTTVKTYASGTDSAAMVPETLTLSSTSTDLVVVANDVLILARTVNGSGLAGPAGSIEIAYKIR